MSEKEKRKKRRDAALAPTRNAARLLLSCPIAFFGRSSCGLEERGKKNRPAGKKRKKRDTAVDGIAVLFLPVPHFPPLVPVGP